MAVTAGFVITAALMAERSGAAIGALVATFPVSAGPSYVFLALDHDPAFIAASAMASLRSMRRRSFSLIYVVLAQRRGALSAGRRPSLSGSRSPSSRSVPMVAHREAYRERHRFGICIRAHPISPREDAADLPQLVRHSVARVDGGGPGRTVVRVGLGRADRRRADRALSDRDDLLMLILQPRIGGPATAALIANTVWGLIGSASPSLYCISPRCNSARQSDLHRARHLRELESRAVVERAKEACAVMLGAPLLRGAKRRSNPYFPRGGGWIASRSLSSGARSHDPFHLR